MVQAWQMPFCAPGTGVLGPRPSAALYQAYFTGQVPSSPPPSLYTHPAPAQDIWNHQALLAALATSGVPPFGPQTTEWFLDTDASSYMSSDAGNGTTLPVTHRASTSIATAHSPLQLKNILVSPSLVKNLIYVRTLTHDNNVIVKFDPFGFLIKDLPTHIVLL